MHKVRMIEKKLSMTKQVIDKASQEWILVFSFIFQSIFNVSRAWAYSQGALELVVALKLTYHAATGYISRDKRGARRTSSGIALLIVTPALSLISMGSFDGFLS